MGGVQYTMTRMINTLINTIADCKRLPCYLIVIIDKDIIADLGEIDHQSPAILQELVRWFV